MTGKPLEKNERPPSLWRSSGGHSSGGSSSSCRQRAHKALIGLWKRTDRPWIGFRKPGDGKGVLRGRGEEGGEPE